ncbi:MAG TPA: aldose 1-epimerase [Rhodanobacter sp.]
MVEIENAILGVRILPEAGGGIAGFDWRGRGEAIALMRRCEPLPDLQERGVDPNRLACYPLLPWSNRIAQGGFCVDGRWISLAPNREDEPLPIHGSGWQRAWQVQSHEAHEVQLSLREYAAAGYHYEATLRYTLLDGALQVDLAVTNAGSMMMPFGLGLHPFFPRHGGVRLHAPAPKVWVNDGRSPLPTERIAVPTAWDFRNERALPEDGLDHVFQEWTGTSTIRWPALRLGLRIDADVDAFVLYTPAGGDFFCMEPVDHPINAVHLPGGAVVNGMTMLSPHATLRRRFAFHVLDSLHDGYG